MIQPIRLQEASGIYQRELDHAGDPGTAGTRRGGAAAGQAGARHDEVSVSSNARHLRAVMEAMPSVPGERADVVAQLRQQTSEGSYRVDADARAERQLDDWLAL